MKIKIKKKDLKRILSESQKQNINEGWREWALAGLFAASSLAIPQKSDILAATKLSDPKITVMKDSDKPDWIKKDIWTDGSYYYCVGVYQGKDPNQTGDKFASRNAALKIVKQKFGVKNISELGNYEIKGLEFNTTYIEWDNYKTYVLGRISKEDYNNIQKIQK